jgi:hypothetical protein
MKAIEAVYQRHKGKGLEVLAINAGQDKATIDAFIKKIGVSYPALLDEKSTIARSYGVVGLPTTFFIDGKALSAPKLLARPMKPLSNVTRWNCCNDRQQGLRSVWSRRWNQTLPPEYAGEALSVLLRRLSRDLRDVA